MSPTPHNGYLENKTNQKGNRLKQKSSKQTLFPIKWANDPVNTNFLGNRDIRGINTNVGFHISCCTKNFQALKKNILKKYITM